MKIIGLAGDARAGKDTVGGMIVDWCADNGLSVAKDSFAAKLKVSAAAALGFESDEARCIAFCDELKQSGMEIVVLRSGSEIVTTDPYPIAQPMCEVEAKISGREFLQLYGTEAHREIFGTNFWVDALFKRYEEVPFPSKQPEVLAITDARFPNEAEAIKSRGGVVVEIIRPNNPDALSGGLEQHTSEVGLPTELLTYRIFNRSTLEDLRAKVATACASLLVI